MIGYGRGLLRFTLTVGMMVLSSEPLLAGPSITVGADHARIVSVAGTPSAVVVGNPLFADVSVQQGVIIVHGRNFGATNVIVLDIDGNQLASFDVNVTNTGQRSISVYKAGQAWSSVCAPVCEYTLTTGEDQEWFKTLNEQHTGKAGQSAGALKLGDQ
jgi:Pilus formation protein N terminal region